MPPALLTPATPRAAAGQGEIGFSLGSPLPRHDLGSKWSTQGTGMVVPYAAVVRRDAPLPRGGQHDVLALQVCTD